MPPLKSWGQNYLINSGIRKKIIDSLNITSEDTVCEIGAGKGALTDLLMESNVKKIVALEPHNESYELLTEKYKNCNKIELLKQDATKFDFSYVENVKIVGNLPYNVSSRILFQLFKTGKNSKLWILMFQKELAQRITSNTGKKLYGSISAMTGMYSESKLLFNVNPGSFFPVPKVDSSVVRFIPKINDDLEKIIFSKQFLISVFSLRRKKISTILKSLYGIEKTKNILEKSSINPHKRPEKITPDEFRLLISIILKYYF